MCGFGVRPRPAIRLADFRTAGKAARASYPKLPAVRGREMTLRSVQKELAPEADQLSAPSRRRPSSAYSASRSLTDRPRRSARAASRSASTAGMITVRRTQSSLSQASPGVSDKGPPLGRYARRFPGRDITAQDPIAQQAQAAEIRKARALSQPGHQRQVERRAEARDRQVELDPAFEYGAREPGLEPAAGLAPEQPLEPAGVEADGHDHEVVGDALALAAVLDRDDNLAFSGLDRHGPPGDRPKPPSLVEDPLALPRENPPVRP